MRITVAAPAKVNLWLRVGDRAPSGFHAIDTLFCALHVADTVVLRPGKFSEPTLEVGHARPLTEAPDLGPTQENLVLRAARAFVDRAGLRTAPKIRLIKRIPTGAGLGGGSSDAAAVLRALARLHPATLTRPELMELGATLGSDVPFFVQGAALARGAGRGERITALPPLPVRPVLVVIPDFPVSTAEAYGWLDEDRGAGPAAGGRAGDVGKPGVGAPAVGEPDAPGVIAEPAWSTVVEAAANDFEGPVFDRHPELRTLRDGLERRGASPALLAGSGSTVFGVFEDEKAAQGAARSLRQDHPEARVLVTRTRAR